MATMAQLLAEAYRLRLMGGLERLVHSCGYGRLAGVDEVGRGSLAGPVVAAAVVVEPGAMVPGVDDSKHLSAEQRERLAEVIRRAHPASTVVAVSPRDIDRLNILQATRKAMCSALLQLDPAPDLALIDAVRLDRLPFPSLPVIRGDQISYAVACASILAKVERDRTMTELDAVFPPYGFAANKGYGAPLHRRALVEHGPCPVHRLTFRSVLPRSEDRARAAGGGR
ncbi:MAG: ribonuclease HII [bacterium]|nr:ribonuclease HII [bacterium]